MLWAQHNDNRMLVPNLVFLGLGVATRDDTTVLVWLSAAVFIAAFALFLILFRSYARLTPIAALMLGFVWFSLIDWQNALWAFQFAWYFILLCLLVMLCCLQRGWFVGAVALAVVASLSSFQGLELWVVGTIWLVWRGWDRRIPVWLGIGVVTTAVYLWRLNAQPTGHAWRHPVTITEFVLVELGEVVPRSGRSGCIDWWASQCWPWPST